MVRSHLLYHPVPRSHDLAALLATLPTGQRRVAAAFVADPWGRTRGETAAALGIHVGTVHRQLARIRARHPMVYAALVAARRAQLAGRHDRARSRAKTRRAVRRYVCQHVHGCEPWEQ